MVLAFDHRLREVVAAAVFAAVAGVGNGEDVDVERTEIRGFGHGFNLQSWTDRGSVRLFLMQEMVFGFFGNHAVQVLQQAFAVALRQIGTQIVGDAAE